MLKAPIVESLGYLIMLREENEAKARNEEMKVWIDYLSLVHSRPLPEKASADQKRSRQDFIDTIRPKTKEKPKGPAKVYKWDFGKLEEMQAMQGRG